MHEHKCLLQSSTRGDRRDEKPYDFEGPVDLTEKSDRDPFAISKQEAASHQGGVRPQQQSLTRRVANAVFSPLSLGLATVVGVPLLLAAAYWLFVVNGPTPVVKARTDEDEGNALVAALETIVVRMVENAAGNLE